MSGKQTYQEIEWEGQYVWVAGILSRSGRMHYNLRHYVGRGGMVLGESKNGMLQVQFKNHVRCIPAGCLVKYTDTSIAGHPRTPRQKSV